VNDRKKKETQADTSLDNSACQYTSHKYIYIKFKEKERKRERVNETKW